MLHPSYTDLMSAINSEVEKGDPPVVNSRYSVVLATAKRTNQLIEGAEPLVSPNCPKPLTIAINELYQSKIKILTEEEERKMEEERKQRLEEMENWVEGETDGSHSEEKPEGGDGSMAAKDEEADTENEGEDMTANGTKDEDWEMEETQFEEEDV